MLFQQLLSQDLLKKYYFFLMKNEINSGLLTAAE
jgi:hypothetical protein